MVRFVSTLGLGLSLLGCDAVTSSAPIGSQAVPIDAKNWDGAWLGDAGEPVRFRVVDSANGILRMSEMEGDDSERRWKHSYLYLRTAAGHEDWIFASMKDDPDDEPPKYVWARVKKQGDYLLVWRPDSTRFQALVEEGALPGELEDDRDIHLQELDEEGLALIIGEERGVLFEWDDPLILRRLDEDLTLCRTPYTMAGCETRRD
jgi:hypothetical protein